MYKRLLINVSILLLPLVAVVLAVNIKVDSGFVINHRSKEIAEILVSGANAGVKYIPSTFGSLQTAIIEERIRIHDLKKKDIVVFGTSRSSEVNSEIFPQNTFFNCAVPGGNILDYIALYGLYNSNHMLPKYLVISIDPWTFHARRAVTINKKVQYISDPSSPLVADKDLESNYRFGMVSLGLKEEAQRKKNARTLSPDDLIQMLSPDYFQTNIQSIFDKMVIKTDRNNVDSYFIIRSDGGYSLMQQSQIDSFYVKENSFKFIDVNKSNFFISADTSSIYWSYFKKLLINLKSHEVTPIVYISPVNPIVYEHLSNSLRVDLEEGIDVFCKDNNILRIGSFNPNKYGYNYVGNYFMDAYHPVGPVVRNIFYSHRNELKDLGVIISNNLN